MRAGFADYFELLRVFDERHAEGLQRRDEVRSGTVNPVPGTQVLAEVRRLVGR